MLRPLGNKIQLDIKETKVGVLESDGIEEHGTIIAVGEKVSDVEMTRTGTNEITFINRKFPTGATLYFKAWAVDVITRDGNKYYFISADSDAICAIE